MRHRKPMAVQVVGCDDEVKKRSRTTVETPSSSRDPPATLQEGWCNYAGQVRGLSNSKNLCVSSSRETEARLRDKSAEKLEADDRQKRFNREGREGARSSRRKS